MKDWELAQRRAHLYEQLCQLTDSLLDLTISWWQADPDLCLELTPPSAQLELPLSDPASPSAAAQRPAKHQELD